MIPKIIHYCWFGRKPLPELAIFCINSWKKHLPDYEIILWNEDNFDLDLYKYTRQAYDAKKYAFVTDVCRLYAIKEIGGIYMDTDVEVLKSMDGFLHHSAFSGFETNYTIPTGLMASEKGSKWATDMLDYYNHNDFIDNNGNLNLTTNVEIISKLMKPKGILLNNKFQEIENYVTFYTNDFFCPKDYISEKINITENTHCIHHFANSWISRTDKILKKVKRIMIRIFGYERMENLILYSKRRLKRIDKEYYDKL